MEKSVKALLRVWMVLGCVLAAWAQPPANRVTCIIDSEVPLLRAEQRAELIGSILITCYGGDPTVVHFVDFELYLNTAITSDLTNPAAGETEALLLIDDPAPGVANVSNGMDYVGQVLGTPGVSPGTGGGPGAEDSGNVYRGIRVTDNRIAFRSVPVVPPPPGTTRTLRITNVRADAVGLASGTGVPKTVLAYLAANSFDFFLQGEVNFAVGRVENSLAVSVLDEATEFELRYQELFPSAFRKRIENTGESEFSARQQGVAGVGLFTESRFTPDFGGLGLDAPGVADTGTRFVAQFHNVPPGMFVLAPANIRSRIGRDIMGEIDARRVVSYLPDLSGGALLEQDNPKELVEMNNGMVTLVYDVVARAPYDGVNGSQDLDEFRIPVDVIFGPLTNIDGVTVTLDYAPADATAVMSGPAPEPRFFNVNPVNNLFEAEGRATISHETFEWFVGDPVPIIRERTYDDPDLIIGGTVTVVPRTGGNWLTAVTADLATTNRIRFAVNPTGLGPGRYVAGVTFRRQDTQDTLRVVPIYLTVKPRPVLFLPLEQSADFEMFLGDPVPPPQTILVNARNRYVVFDVTSSTATGGDWLIVSPDEGSTPQELTVSVNPAGLAPGTYDGALTVRSDAAVNSPLIVPVSLVIRRRAPVFEMGAVTNAASYVNGSVSPGEMVTFFGEGLGPVEPAGLVIENGRVATQVAGTRILFNNVPAPIISTASGQTTCIVPFSVAGMRGTTVIFEFLGVQSDGVSLPVSSSKPGIFTASMTGTGQGAILNQDGSVNSAANPAEAGSVIVVYLTGGGQTSPPGDAGRVNRLVNPPELLLDANARVGGYEAMVEWIGGAPGQAAAVIQANIRTDPRVAAGDAVPVVIGVGDFLSQPGVTAAIR